MQHQVEQEERPGKDGGRASWPYSSLLLLGYFGADTRAGRLLVWRGMGALAVIMVSGAVLHAATGPTVLGMPLALWAAAIPLAVVAIGWAHVRYLASLDELARLIQLQALAFSYGAAMTLAAVLFGVSMIGDRQLPAHLLLALLVLVEPMRGAALVYFARQHE
jgi:hypothetical protein